MHLPPGVKCLGTRVGLELGVWHFALAVQAVYRNLHWIWPHWYCGLARDLCISEPFWVGVGGGEVVQAWGGNQTVKNLVRKVWEVTRQ